MTLPPASASGHQPTVAIQRPLLHLPVYDYSPPCAVAAIAAFDGSGRISPETQLQAGLFRVRFYETGVGLIGSVPPSVLPGDVGRVRSLTAMALVTGDRLRGVATLRWPAPVGVSVTPESVNADGTVNWRWNLSGVSVRTTGFLAPIAVRTATLEWPETVHVRTRGSLITVAYVPEGGNRGRFVVKEVNVGSPVFLVLGPVDLDAHRSAIVAVTSRGQRVIVVDRGRNAVTTVPGARAWCAERWLIVAVPDGQDTLVAAAVLVIPGVTPTLVRARVSGRVLAVGSYRGVPLLVVGAGNDVALAALPVGSKPVVVPPVKRWNGGAEFALPTPDGRVLLVTYDGSTGRIRVRESNERPRPPARTPGVRVTVLTADLADPKAHGGVVLDLSGDLRVLRVSKLGTVKVATPGGIAVGTLYRIDTDWGRFYGAVVGSRLILVPAEVHPVTGDLRVLTVRVDARPNPDGTVSVTVHDPIYGALSAPRCLIADWSYEPTLLPVRALIQRLARMGISVGSVTLGSFAPARITGTVSTSPAAPMAVASATLTLPDGTALRLSGLPLTALITGDGGLVVISGRPMQLGWYQPRILRADAYEVRGGRVKRLKAVLALPARLGAHRLTVGPWEPESVVVLLHGDGTIRVLFTYPYPEAPHLLSALDAVPVIAEVSEPGRCPPTNVRSVTVRVGDAVLVCCAWRSGDRVSAVAVDVTTGRTIRAARVDGRYAYLPWRDGYLRIDLILGSYRIVRSLPEETPGKEGHRGVKPAASSRTAEPMMQAQGTTASRTVQARGKATETGATRTEAKERHGTRPHPVEPSLNGVNGADVPENLRKLVGTLEQQPILVPPVPPLRRRRKR